MNVKAIFVGVVLVSGSINNALADSCRENIFGGQDCRYDNGTTSSSRANIFGGQDVQYSDGRTSTSRANIFGGQDVKNSDGSSSTSRANIFDGRTRNTVMARAQPAAPIFLAAGHALQQR